MIKNRRLLYINSANRISGTDASNCLLEVKIPQDEKWTHVAVVDCNIPKSYYLIQDGYNTFTLVEEGQHLTVTIPPANYGANCFRETLGAVMTAASTHAMLYTVTLPSPTEPQTGKWTYTVTDPTGLYGQPSILAGDNVYEQLGFNMDSTNAFVGDVLVSTNVIKLQSEDTLYMHSDIVTGLGADVLQEIYTIGVPDFGIINYRMNDWLVSAKPLSSATSDVFRFALTDEFARTLNLNGLNWQMTLMVFTIKEPLQLSLD